MSETFFLSPPRRDWALRARANFRSKEAAPVDPLRARKEWLAFAERLDALGGRVIVLRSPDSALTGMPFAAEAGHVLRDGRFLLPRMAAVHRRGEETHWRLLCDRVGIATVELQDGFFEGQGDVGEFLGVTLVFFGGRSTESGARAAAAAIGGETLLVRIKEPAFHGNMALLPLERAKKMLICKDVVAPESLAAITARFGEGALVPITLDELFAYSTNALPFADTILAPSLVPSRVVGLFEGLGYRVERLAMDELCGKAGGASRCLVCRTSAPLPDVPETFSLAAARAEILAD
ncbi:MAG: amidinotransferase [Deltaproteobacteria bacterium]|nr:amidinotransferase [Deltaproteobacteria bacterium]